MNILITGASGLIGSALLEFLFAKGHTVFSLQRHKEPGAKRFWNFDRISASASSSRFDAVIHLAGENIANGRWNKRKKDRILRSRVAGTQELAKYCAALSPKPEVILCASAIGYYGDRGEEILDESSANGTNFVAGVCREWEQAATPAATSGMRVVHARIGMVLSAKGGTLPTMLPSFKLGIAGIVGDGAQFISWIGMQDVLKIFHLLLENRDFRGPVNLVAPEPVTNREFTKILGTLVDRPTVMKMPAFVARTLFGQMGEELVLSSVRVKPRLLEQQGYRFISPDLKATLSACLASKPEST